MNTSESVVDQQACTRLLSDEQVKGKKLILIVDDEPVMQELGRDILEEHGYRVLVASDGLEALDMYRQYGDEIDLVVLDMLMPRLDGGQTYIEMKKMNVDIKAFFCTGYTPTEVIGPLLAEESLRALQKPFRPSEFVNTVRDVLSS
ncbi:MAG: response regulator [Bacteroidetes bacterium]|nr:response regulator [Bacteroidota bacterium]MCW5895125.1 response regulator [Bacteroidota bacterium]